MILPKQESAASPFQYRRMPAVARRINSVNPETDIRVRILGKVIDKYDGTAVIDDGSGKAEVVMDEGFDKVEAGDVVRVFCRVLPLETGYELRAELVQSMRDFDMDAYRKIHG